METITDSAIEASFAATSDTNDASNFTVYFDQDGVLAIYEREGYITPEIDPFKNSDVTPTAPFMTPGSHYFRHLKPDEKAIKVLKLLHDKGIRYKIITKVSNKGSLFLEQTRDKIEWLHEYAPFVDTDKDFIATAGDKGSLAKAIYDYTNLGFTSFSVNHILIDDYNNNLDGWNYEGGTALKYSNGLNSEDSYKGIVLDKSMTAEDIVDLIVNHLNWL